MSDRESLPNPSGETSVGRSGSGVSDPCQEKGAGALLREGVSLAKRAPSDSAASAVVSSTFTFEIVSPKHGRFVVTAPLRFRAEIESRAWHVLHSPSRAEGRQFSVAHSLSREHVPRTLHLHRFIWELLGRPPAPVMDHVDGQPLNNAEENLRAATYAQNQWNRGPSRKNTNGIVGVYWHPRNRKWHARMWIDGRNRHLGCFDDLTEAARARDEAAVKHFGEFAFLNIGSAHGS